MIEQLGTWTGLAPQVITLLIAIYGILVFASVISFLKSRGRDKTDKPSELTLRIQSWWIMITAFALAIVISRSFAAVLLGFISYMAIKEYFSMIPTRRIDRSVLLWAYLAIPIQFWWAYTDWYGMFMVFIPVWMFLFLPMVMVIRGETEGFLGAVGTLSWGMMMTVFTISHMAYILFAGDSVNTVAGGAGLLIFLIFITQFNDVAQFTWGKLCGGRIIGKIMPKVSPNKTWEGFLGGLLTSAAVAALAGPYLTIMDWQFSAAAGAMIAIAGFFGDVTLSALKRDLGVKDTGALIPGHGGVLDRIDSLTYAAPVFVHAFRYFYFP